MWLECRKCRPDLFTEEEKFKAKYKIADICTGDYEIKSDSRLNEMVDLNTFCLKKNPNVRIQLEKLFDSTMEVIDEYFICDGCGHMYWVATVYNGFLN